MMAVQMTFKRYELKYMLTRRQAALLKEAMRDHMALDRFGHSTIRNIYLDTDNFRLVRRSIEKPLYKEKLRVRSYGAFSQSNTVFLEIKKKYKGIVYKRRVRMSKRGYEAYVQGMSYEQAQERYPVEASNAADDLKPGKLQIARELDAFFRRYDDLMPSMVISCLREAWAPIDPCDEDCVDRVTFDENISYIDLFEQGSTARRPVIGSDQIVMEIKCAGGYPIWLCDLLSAVGAYPRSFSKYGNAYKHSLAQRGAVEVAQSESGKVAVRTVTPKNRRRGAEEDVLIAPSAGFEVIDSKDWQTADCLVAC